MIKQLKWLYFRYTSNRELARQLGREMFAPDGRWLGSVDGQTLIGTRLKVTGKTVANAVKLHCGHSQVEVSCDQLVGEDTIETAGTRTFTADIPYSLSPVIVSIFADGMQRDFTLRAIPTFRRRIGQARCALTLAGRLVWASPLIWRWWKAPGMVSTVQIKAKLGIIDTRNIPIVDLNQLGRQDNGRDLTNNDEKIIIIVPVYNNLDLVKKVLRRILRYTDLPAHLLIVEDSSPEEEIRPYLLDWVDGQDDDVTLILNENNLGFVGSVNKAFEVVKGLEGNVVLLNADALVPEGWASRLLAPIARDPRVATVTPMSNDAEIFSIPQLCCRTELASEGLADAIDRAARNHVKAGLAKTAPTGVGFCMAINRRFLDAVPGFDPIFGRGYGEEVDWCQKTRQLGGKHVVEPGLFVEHRGSASFGSEAKRELVQKHNTIISKRYPNYDQEVQEFASNDPIATARMCLALAWASLTTSDPLCVYLGHSMGGGAEIFLQQKLDSHVAEDRAAVVIRVGGVSRFVIELYHQGGVSSLQCDDISEIKSVFSATTACRFIYSCGVGDSDPLGLPKDLCFLCREGQDTLEVLVHDFFMVSPSYCLLDDQDKFRGVPSAKSCDHLDPLLVKWQESWGTLLRSSDQITVFSHSSRKMLLQAYPNIEERITVRPHRLPTDVPSIRSTDQDRCVVGVLGNIGPQKGAQVIADMSALLVEDERLVVLGELAPSFRLRARGHVHGGYQIRHIEALVKKYGITCWVVPSIWPETFSFVTHEALSTSMPVVTFDLGAQAEAARQQPNGHVVPFDPDLNLAELMLRRVRQLVGT